MLFPAFLLLLLAQAAAAQPDRVMGFDRARVVEAVISRNADRPSDWVLEVRMARRLTGVTAVLRGRELRDLLRAEPRDPLDVGSPPGATTAAYLHIRSHRNHRKVIRLVRAGDGGYVGEELGEDGEVARRIELIADAILPFTPLWAGYRGDYASEPDHPRAQVFELEHPLVPSPHSIDKETLSERFWGGRPVSIEGTTRDLADEHLHARLPVGYTPRSPAGLLVWVNAGDSGEPPPPFFQALDELGLICVGAASAGNGRYIADRYQLALDAVANATRRFHVDPRRVYITGISGGGRTASMLQGCYPDVFAGCVPIVGVNTFRRVPNGTGGFWRAGYAPPDHHRLRLLRDRRIAPMTGNQDFNYDNIIATAYVMRQDGLDVRVFEWPDMGHTLPTPDRFLEALSWVDEPWRERREKEQAAADEKLGQYIERFGNAPVTESSINIGAQRRLLLQAMQAGPWTEPAWTAAELLGLAPDQ